MVGHAKARPSPRHPAMKSRADTYEGLASAVCKEGLPGHAVLRGLASCIDAAVAAAEGHGERVPPSVRRSAALLSAWCDGVGSERDLVAAGAVLEQERQAYVLLWNEKMARAAERKAAGEDPKYPVSTYLRHLSDATAFCLSMAAGLVPRGEPCSEGALWTVFKDLQATFLVLSDDRRSMASDRAAGRAMASAFRAGVRAAPLDPPASNHVLIPPKTQAQLDFEARLKLERFMGAFGCPVEDPSATLLDCALPAPEDSDAGRTSRVGESALEDLGLVRRYEIDEVLEKRRNSGATPSLPDDPPSAVRLQRVMRAIAEGSGDAVFMSGRSRGPASPPSKPNPRRGPRPLVEPAVRPLLDEYGAVTRPLGELPRAAQLAVGTYERWHSPDEVVGRLRDVPFGYVELPMRELTSLIVRNLNEAHGHSFRSFAEVHRWYESTHLLPDHPKSDRWPVILSRPSREDAEGVIEDGWHRLNDYYRKGASKVPAVFYTSAFAGA